MTNWKSIRTAPKDGTRVLIAWMENGEAQIRAAYWDVEFEMIDYTTKAKYRKAWTDDAVRSFGYEERKEYTPTHWMKLPPFYRSSGSHS